MKLGWERARFNRFVALTRDGVPTQDAVAILDREFPMPHACDACGKRYSTLEGIDRHREKKHRGLS